MTLRKKRLEMLKRDQTNIEELKVKRARETEKAIDTDWRKYFFQTRDKVKT